MVTNLLRDRRWVREGGGGKGQRGGVGTDDSGRAGIHGLVHVRLVGTVTRSAGHCTQAYASHVRARSTAKRGYSNRLCAGGVY